MSRVERKHKKTDKRIPRQATRNGHSAHSTSGVENLLSLQENAALEMRPASLFATHKGVLDFLTDFDPIETAAAFGAMLLDPRLQANFVRLEALVHLSIGCCKGTRQPTQGELASCFEELGTGICGRMEDPTEDVFVSLVTTKEGHYRVLEGDWESASFYLQRILNIVETFPNNPPFSDLRRQIFALLRLSDATCERAGLSRNCTGGPLPLKALPPEVCGKFSRQLTSFNDDELTQIEVTPDDLQEFLFSDQMLTYLSDARISNSPLQWHPLVRTDGTTCLLLPTAVSSAIRCAVIAFLQTRGLGNNLRFHLAEEYSSLFQNTRLLGSFSGMPIIFNDEHELPIAETPLIEFDAGRYVQFVWFTDTLTEFFAEGLVGVDQHPAEHSELLAMRIRNAANLARQRVGYRGGITLLVYCGVGRPTLVPLPNEFTSDWQVEFVPAPDLATLSNKRGFDALKLWRILDGTKRLAELGSQIHNPFGLINLVAWVYAHEGHLVPHALIPKDFRYANSGILVEPGYVLELRHQTAIENDSITILSVGGQRETVRRVNDSFFPRECELPVYAVETFSRETGVPFVIVTGQRSWWCHVLPVAGDGSDFERWQMVKTWLPRIAQQIEAIVDQSLPNRILIRISFKSLQKDDKRWFNPKPTREVVEQEASIELDADDATVSIAFGDFFELAQAQSVNVSERVLVASILSGVMRLAKTPCDKRCADELEATIVGSDDARHMHYFTGYSFRGYTSGISEKELVSADDIDVANIQLGLAFRVESRVKGRCSLRTKKTCTEFLNGIVRDLESELCSELRTFNRGHLVEQLIRNHERAAMEKERWTLTAKANIAMRGTRDSVVEVITDHENRFNATLLSSRTLVEIAICECPETGGAHAGRLDLSRFLAITNLIWHLGGWSDAIHYDAMLPKLAITPFGDIREDDEFAANVVRPYGRKGVDNRIRQAIDSYEDNFTLPGMALSNGDEVDRQFEEAWQQEFGFTIRDVRLFMDSIEDVGLNTGQVLFRVRYSNLRTMGTGEDLTPARVDKIIDCFALRPRDAWRNVPDGFEVEDLQPWRYGRHLSAIRRPLIQLSQGTDPEFVVAPGLVRESVIYVLRGHYDTTYSSRFSKGNKCRFGEPMNNWYVRYTKERGTKFANLAAETIKKCGWKVYDKREVGMKELLSAGTDPEFGKLDQYGDVDVIAWHEQAKRLLLIECKHLSFRKTAGEIAEQLSDYKGKMRGKKPDELLKHLNRLKVIRARKVSVLKKLRLSGDYSIEGWTLFKYAVPMLFSWAPLKSVMQIAIFDEIDQMLGVEGSVKG